MSDIPRRRQIARMSAPYPDNKPSPASIRFEQFCIASAVISPVRQKLDQILAHYNHLVKTTAGNITYLPMELKLAQNTAPEERCVCCNTPSTDSSSDITYLPMELKLAQNTAPEERCVCCNTPSTGSSSDDGERNAAARQEAIEWLFDPDSPRVAIVGAGGETPTTDDEAPKEDP